MPGDVRHTLLQQYRSSALRCYVDLDQQQKGPCCDRIASGLETNQLFFAKKKIGMFFSFVTAFYERTVVDVAVVAFVVVAAVVDGVANAGAAVAVASLLQMEGRCSIIFIDDGD